MKVPEVTQLSPPFKAMSDDPFRFCFAVVNQYYEAQVYDVFVIKGNTAVFKCQIPSFVSDHVEVTSWQDTAGNKFLPPNDDYGNQVWSGGFNCRRPPVDPDFSSSFCTRWCVTTVVIDTTVCIPHRLSTFNARNPELVRRLAWKCEVLWEHTVLLNGCVNFRENVNKRILEIGTHVSRKTWRALLVVCSGYF